MSMQPSTEAPLAVVYALVSPKAISALQAPPMIRILAAVVRRLRQTVRGK